MTTEDNKYAPTPAERKLLEVMLNPEHRNLSITDICKEADVSRTVYYDAFDKDEFVGYYTAKSRDLISESLGPVINACVKMAKDGSHPHIKTILEMADLHLDKIGVVGGDGENISFNINFVDPPSE